MTPKILVLCTGNSCRSQMAEGLLRHHAQQVEKKVTVYSAGVETHGLNPRAVQAMQAIGIDISHHQSELVDQYLNTGITHVITVCDNAKESCPVFPEQVHTIHHSFPDPAGANGTEEEIKQEFGAVRDLIDAFAKDYLNTL